MVFYQKLFVACTVAALSLGGSNQLSADLFQLHQGGQVEGNALPHPQEDQPHVTIELPTGGAITLLRDQVAETVEEGDDLAAYRQVAPQYSNSVEGQWNLALWCLDHALPEQSEVHLRQVIQLDPNHAAARSHLGFQFLDGKWLTLRQWREEQGLIYYSGRWRTAQEVELLEAERTRLDSEQHWIVLLRRYRENLRGDRAHEMSQRILAINDPFALPALRQASAQERNRDVKRLYLQAIDHIGTDTAIMILMERSLDDWDEEIRLDALDLVVNAESPVAVDFYVGHLLNLDNQKINRAAYALAKLGDERAIEPLIFSLITIHGVVNRTTGEAITRSFGDDGVQMRQGNSQEVTSRTYYNQQVQRTLVQLTSQNFGFEVDQWQTWLAAHRTARRPVEENLRSE